MTTNPFTLTIIFAVVMVLIDLVITVTDPPWQKRWLAFYMPAWTIALLVLSLMCFIQGDQLAGSIGLVLSVGGAGVYWSNRKRRNRRPSGSIDAINGVPVVRHLKDEL